LKISLGGLVFLSGFSLRILLAKCFRQDPLELFDTLEHELTHALLGYLTGHPPKSLKASLKGGGEVLLTGYNPFIVLSPYVVPLFAGMFALILPWLREDLQAWGMWIWMFLLGSFFYRWTREMHFGQSDFRAYGFLYSLGFLMAWIPLVMLALLTWTGWIGDGFWPNVITKMLESLRDAWNALLRSNLFL
jgi:hypothetical protein